MYSFCIIHDNPIEITSYSSKMAMFNGYVPEGMVQVVVREQRVPRVIQAWFSDRFGSNGGTIYSRTRYKLRHFPSNLCYQIRSWSLRKLP